MQAMRAHLAGILRQRVGVHEALGHAEAAQQDEQRLAELAAGGQLVASPPYPLSTAIQRVNRVASVLDTRGFVLYRMGELEAALEDLERASQAGEWLTHAMEWVLNESKHRMTDVRPILQRQRQDARTRAVIAYHRMLVLQALGRAEEAERDAQLVRELGYEPGEGLF
jgi:tetratricopeptide (TPR) repeat protein